MQSLSAFQSVFKVEPVRIEYSEFAKDGAIASAVEALQAEGLDAIYLMPLTSEKRAAFEASIVGKDGKQRDMANLYARYVNLSWVDGPEGKPLGTAKEIGALRADLVAEIFEMVQKINGVKTDSVDEAGKD